MLKNERIIKEMEWFYGLSGEARRCHCSGQCGSEHDQVVKYDDETDYHRSCEAVDATYICRVRNSHKYHTLNFIEITELQKLENVSNPELVRITVKTINDKPILLCQFCDKAITKAEKEKKKAEKSEKKRLESQDPLPFKEA